MGGNARARSKRDELSGLGGAALVAFQPVPERSRPISALRTGVELNGQS